jgi:tetratricopeptide (TPR) repeat protein
MTEIAGPLRAARQARGWSQSRAAEEMVTLARLRGIEVAAPASLKTQLSRWENQHALPDPHYRSLLAELYQSSEPDLGLAELPGPAADAGTVAESLRANLAAFAAMDETALALLGDQLRATHAVDDELGGTASAGAVGAQLEFLEHALRHTVDPRNRRELGRLVADAACLSGRVALDRSRHAEAWSCYEAAKFGAHEAESPPLLSVALAEQAVVSSDIGESEPALSMVERAIAVSTPAASGPLRAWLEASRGAALAGVGSADGARAAYQESERELSAAAGMDLGFRELPSFRFDLAGFRRHRGHTYRVIHEDESAIEDLDLALRAGHRSVRDLAELHVDLARAHSAVGRRPQASRHARQAREITTRIGSLRLSAQLDAAPDAELTRSS